jgi:hypothetical protein
MLTRSRRLLSSAAVASAAAVLIAGAATPAAAATVLNNYNCSKFTYVCVQINGRHVNGIPNACTWVWDFYAVGSPTSICNVWR